MQRNNIVRSVRRREGRVQAEDASTWKCQTCHTIIESGTHCWPCASYWEDCKNGLWADDWEPVRPSEITP
jgi:hypothetical protein